MTCPHCARVNAEDALRCANCGADLVAAEPGGPVPLEGHSLLLWVLVAIPGAVVTVWALVASSLTLAAVAAALLLIPLLVQVFVADWGDAG